MPLDNKQLENQNNGNPDIQPDFVIKNLHDLRSLLIFDDPVNPTTSSRQMKLKKSRSAAANSTPSLGVSCFNSKNKPYQRKFQGGPPDLENNNSNASDGSWFKRFSLFYLLTKNIRFGLFDGIM